MRFDLPAGADIEALRRTLAAIEEALHIEISLSPA